MLFLFFILIIMMNYGSMQSMMGGSTSGASFLMWIVYLFVLVDLILIALALWKYISKK